MVQMLIQCSYLLSWTHMEALPLLHATSLLDGTKLPTPLHFTSPTSQTAHDSASSTSAPSAIFARPDKSWNHTCPHISFSDSYHSWFPSMWTHQILGLNIIFGAMPLMPDSILYLTCHTLLLLAAILAESLLYFLARMQKLQMACLAHQFLLVEHACKHSFYT